MKGGRATSIFQKGNPVPKVFQSQVEYFLNVPTQNRCKGNHCFCLKTRPNSDVWVTQVTLGVGRNFTLENVLQEWINEVRNLLQSEVKGVHSWWRCPRGSDMKLPYPFSCKFIKVSKSMQVPSEWLPWYSSSKGLHSESPSIVWYISH